uniref:Uncharacterized protein n=1 Tax=Mastacembelus armatus TaxID=205130 RepID=A0A3Q3L899_9TELE
VIPSECPDKKFVLVVGDSHLRSVVDGVVPMPECHMSFGISSTPGAAACELQRELAETVLPREPALVCLLAPSNNLTASRTVDEAATQFGQLLTFICSLFNSKMTFHYLYCVQTLLSQLYHRVSAHMGVRYFPVAEHFPMARRELWSRDGVHLSDSDGMDILVQLLFKACYQELETPASTVPVSPGPSCSPRRVLPKVVVTGPLPVPRPPPSEWTVVGQGRKNVFSIPLSPVTFSSAMLSEMEKISPSDLESFKSTTSFPVGKKVNCLYNLIKVCFLFYLISAVMT